MSHVFHRAPNLPIAAGAEGVWIFDSSGRRYLDACGGAIVNGVGHGRSEVVAAIAGQLASVDYVHGHSFGTAVLEEYADRLAELVPVDDARLFPVSGGSEATETAIKLARAHHLALGRPERSMVLGRWGSYHGNTLGALDLSGRPGLRSGYEPWLGRFGHLPQVNEYRCPSPGHPAGCGSWHAAELERVISDIGAERVAAFMAEPIGGASVGAAVPPDGYWSAVVDVCRRHDILVIGDEVMTGFGRTGRWFGLDHFDQRVDIVTIGKGASSGYWPLGGCVAAAPIVESAASIFRHGYTFSHHPGGAAAGLAVLDIIESEDLVARSDHSGAELERRLGEAIGGHEHVGDIRGRGLLVAVEFVADRATRRPFARSDQVTERLRTGSIEAGIVPYPIAGCADGEMGDGLMFGPPFVITEREIDMIVDGTASAVRSVLG